MPHPESADSRNWYSFLGVGLDATTEQISAAVERLSRQANALAVTAPERARQLRDQIRLIKQDLLGGAESRERYDRGLRAREADDTDADVTRPRQLPAPGPSAQPAPPSAQPARSSAQPARPSAQPARPTGTQGPGLMARISKFLQTGWTCVSCGYGAQPGDRFCAKCGGRVESGLGGQSPDASD